MANYYINEALFALPERAFIDRTVHTLESKLPGGGTLVVIVLRRPMEGGKSLRELVDGHIAAGEKRLGGFTILDDTEDTVADAPAILVRSRWRHEGEVLYQRQAHVALDGTWMLFAATGPLEERAACDETFESIVQSLAWRGG
jgi:hypothetical protein